MTVIVKFNGVHMTATDAARLNGIAPDTVRMRIKRGMSPDLAVWLPPVHMRIRQANAVKLRKLFSQMESAS